MRFKADTLFHKFIHIVEFTYLIIFSPFLEAKEKYSWEFIPFYTSNADWLMPVDVNDDGVDELLECKDNYCLIKSQTGAFIMQYTAGEKAKVHPVGAFQLDTRTNNKEVVLCVVNGDTSQLFIWGKNGTRRIFNAYTGKDIRNVALRGYDTQIFRAIGADVNADGSEDLVCFVRTGFDLYPRGVFVYDYKNNKELWHYWMGANPSYNSLFVIDVDNDQKDEIVLGTHAVANGAIENGIDDTHSWVIVLGLDGKLKWKKQMHGTFTWTELLPVDIDKDGNMEIIVCETQGAGDKKEQNMLSILDARTGELKKYIGTGERFMGMAVCDYNRDGNLDIITGNTDGVLRIFNANLEITATKKFATGIYLVTCFDFDNSGTFEILLNTADAKLTIVNEKLDIIGYTQLTVGLYDPLFQIVKDAGQYEIIVGLDKRRIGLYKINHISGLDSKLIEHILLLLSLAFFIIIIFLLVGLIRHKRIVRIIVDNAPIACFVLNNKNKPIYMNHKCVALFEGSAEHIDLLLKNSLVIEKLRLKENTKISDFMIGNRKFEITFYPIANLNVIALIDKTLTLMAETIISWAGFAQKLAHEIKNPLSTINLTLQRIQSICKEKLGKSGESIDKYTNSALEEVIRLRETVDKFMRILSLEKPNIMPININEILDKALNRLQLSKPRGIKLQKFYNPDLPVIYCDESQLNTAFSNIIENAFEAMGNKGVLTIRTNLTETINDYINTKNNNQEINIAQAKNNGQNTETNKKIHKFVEVRVEDTGEGMSEEELGNLFKPFWSTKKSGTGLGLVIAFRVIDMQRGKIEITSKKGIGTVVTVLLPVQQEGNNEHRS